MAKSYFTKLCNPAKLYLVVSVLGLVYGLFQRFSILTLGTNFIFVILWTMVLNYICSVGMKMVSWILVLLPYLMMFLSAGFVMDMMREGGGKQGFQTCPPNQVYVDKNTYGEPIPGFCRPKMTQLAINTETETQKHCRLGNSFYDNDTKKCYSNPCPSGTILKPTIKTWADVGKGTILDNCMCTLNGQKFVNLKGFGVGCYSQKQIDDYSNSGTKPGLWKSGDLLPKVQQSPSSPVAIVQSSGVPTSNSSKIKVK